MENKGICAAQTLSLINNKAVHRFQFSTQDYAHIFKQEYTIPTNQQGESAKYDPKVTPAHISAVIEMQRSGATEQNTS